MKEYLLPFLFLIIPFICTAQTECSVEAIYKMEELPDTDAIVLNDNDEIEELDDLIEDEAEYLLVPIELKPGNYKIDVSELDSDVYEVEFEDLIIETRSCYEYVYSEEAILKVESYQGHNFATLIFED